MVGAGGRGRREGEEGGAGGRGRREGRREGQEGGAGGRAGGRGRREGQEGGQEGGRGRGRREGEGEGQEGGQEGGCKNECSMTHLVNRCTHFAIWSNMVCTFATSLRSLELKFADLTRTRPVDLMAAAPAGSLSRLEAELGLPLRGSLCDSLLTARSILLATSRSEGTTISEHPSQCVYCRCVKNCDYMCMSICVILSIHVDVSVHVHDMCHCVSVTVSLLSMCQHMALHKERTLWVGSGQPVLHCGDDLGVKCRVQLLHRRRGRRGEGREEEGI